MYKSFFKPILDVLLAIIGLLILSPLFLLTALILLFNNRGTPFFFQQRPGKNEVIFKIIKFKTMTDKKDSYGNLLPDKERLTKVGVFIRKASLDEIPQLLNVIKGDMSLIGPRPLLPEYLSLYNTFQKRRHSIKPGVSGWAQVNGRNAISWQQKFEYDVWYADNISFFLDVKIIFKTILKVFKTEGITDQNNAVGEKFKGNN